MSRRFEDMTEPELKAVMREACKAVERSAQQFGVERLLFVLLASSTTRRWAQYAANCRREDCILALREAADRLDQREDRTRTSSPRP